MARTLSWFHGHFSLFELCAVYSVARFFSIGDMVTVTDRHYGVHTNSKQIPAYFAFSEENTEVQAAMKAMQRLDCGHGHMGIFWKCSSCDFSKCGKCWMRCRDPVIKGLLGAPASMKMALRDYGREWLNTCSVCKGNDRCLEDCPSRKKFSISDDGVVTCSDLVWGCNCRTCLDKRYAFSCNWAIKPTLCRAVKGYEVDELESIRAQLPDQHMCRACFASDFTRMEAMPLTIHGVKYKVVFRASRHDWRDIKRMKADPPHHYIHSLEEGMQESAVEWACLHVGRNHSCHWEGHTCEMLSTSILCSEAIRRLSPDRGLQVICIQEDRWDSGCVDFSSRESMAQYSKLQQHLEHHKILRANLEAWGCRFREVVLDVRAIRADMLMEWVFEMPAEDKLVRELQRICRDADEKLHCDSGGWLHAERACRSLIAERQMTTMNQPWLKAERACRSRYAETQRTAANKPVPAIAETQKTAADKLVPVFPMYEC